MLHAEGSLGRALGRCTSKQVGKATGAGGRADQNETATETEASSDPGKSSNSRETVGVDTGGLGFCILTFACHMDLHSS